MMPEKFMIPWSAVDPTLAHGGIDGELAEGWVAPDLNDNTRTQNRDIQHLEYMLCQFATAISMHPEAELAGAPGRAVVQDAFSAMTTFVEKLVDVTHSHATKFFAFTHAVPPVSDFIVTPIRYPVRNRFAEDFLHYAIGTCVELAENNRNSVHQGLDPQASNKILEAMWTWKATQMKYWFDIEVAGEISSEELAQLYSGLSKPVPSYPDETAERPDGEAVAQALSGFDVLSWLPDAADWTKFAELQARRYKPERALQPEAARPITEDVLPPGGVDMPEGGPNV